MNKSGDTYWYPATIAKKAGDRYFVVLRNGIREWADPSRLTEDDIKVGSRVFGNWKNGGHYYPGRITRRNGVNIHISYDDGDQEDTTVSAVRVLRPGVD